MIVFLQHHHCSHTHACHAGRLRKEASAYEGKIPSSLLGEGKALCMLLLVMLSLTAEQVYVAVQCTFATITLVSLPCIPSSFRVAYSPFKMILRLAGTKEQPCRL